jgi:hypothetical protein
MKENIIIALVLVGFLALLGLSGHDQLKTECAISSCSR